VFTISIAFIIIQGKLAFERVIENKAEDEEARIALSYVNKRIRQNDVQGQIELLEKSVEGQEALRIAYDEEGLYTYIYFYDGVLYECYTDQIPTVALSTKIATLANFDFDQDNQRITMTLDYEYHGEVMRLEQTMALRSKGGRHE
jgi:hypothetical protein